MKAGPPPESRGDETGAAPGDLAAEPERHGVDNARSTREEGIEESEKRDSKDGIDTPQEILHEDSSLEIYTEAHDNKGDQQHSDSNDKQGQGQDRPVGTDLIERQSIVQEVPTPLNPRPAPVAHRDPLKPELPAMLDVGPGLSVMPPLSYSRAQGQDRPVGTDLIEQPRQHPKKQKRGQVKSALRIPAMVCVLATLIVVPYILLSRGIDIESISVGSITLNKIHMRLEDRFVLLIDELDISSDKQSSDKQKEAIGAKEVLDSVSGYIQKSIIIMPYFKELRIKKISIDDYDKAHLSYTKNSYKVDMPMLEADFDINKSRGNLNIKVNRFNLKEFSTNIIGDIAYRIKSREITLDIKVLTGTDESEYISINGVGDISHVRIKANSSNIKDMSFAKKYVNDIRDDKTREAIYKWAFENTKYEHVQIDELSMQVDLGNIYDSILGNTLIRAKLCDASVELNDGLKPMRAQEIELEFKDKLIIRPKGAEFDGHSMDGSFVEVDVTTGDIDIHVHTKDVRMTQGIRNLLENYGVDLPIAQIDSRADRANSGGADVDIGIHIDTSTDPNDTLVDIKGTIQGRRMHMNVAGLHMKASEARVELEITPERKLAHVHGKRVSMYGVIDADVHSTMDLDAKSMEVHAFVHHAKVNTENMNNIKIYDLPKARTNAEQSSQGDTIDSVNTGPRPGLERVAYPQGWNAGYEQPLPDSMVSLAAYSGWAMASPAMLDSGERWDTRRTAGQEILELVADEKPAQDQQENAEYKNDKNVLTKLQENKIWNDLKIRNIKTRPFKIMTKREIEEEALAQVIKEQDLHLDQDLISMRGTKISFTVKFGKDLDIDVPSLGLRIVHNDEGTHVSVSRLDDIASISPIMAFYGIRSGSAHVGIKAGDEDKSGVEFDIDLLNLKYPMYDSTGRHLDSIHAMGYMRGNAMVIKTNKNISFKSKDSLGVVDLSGYRIDVDQAKESQIPFLKDLLDKGDEDGASPVSKAEIAQYEEILKQKQKIRREKKLQANDLRIQARDVEVVLSGYGIPLDRANIRISDGKIAADASYENGVMNANIIKGKVTFKAKHFSGDFLNRVMRPYEKDIVVGGLFSLVGMYNGDTLNCAIDFNNTSISDLKVIQNIFSIIDAVPSLIAFKNPHILTDGYKVKYGKIYLAVNSKYIGLQNIMMVGETMDVNGHGIIDIESEEISANLNISTVKNLTNIIKKIPIVGYLILGKEGKISTNLFLTGRYKDPKVNITLAADIIKAPINIIRRIFTPIDMVIDSIRE